MSGTEASERVTIRKYAKNRFARVEIDLVREIAFEIHVNGSHVVTTACAGLHPEEMAAGFLKSEGLIQSREDIRKMTLSRNGKAIRILTRDTNSKTPLNATKLIGSSGARLQLEAAAKKRGAARFGKKGLNATGPILKPQNVIDLMEGLLCAAEIHDRTRGTHCSALASSEGLIVAREDIGRHNTLDMLGGYALLNGVDCSDKIVLTTGRVSSEIVSKVSRIGAPVIISHSAAMTRAVAQAEELGMTLIGYVRTGNFNIYSDRMGRIKKDVGRWTLDVRH